MAGRKYKIKSSPSVKVTEPITPYGHREPLNFEKVWLIFQETDKKFQETDKKFQETDKKFQETERILRESKLDLDKRSKEADKRMKQLVELFTGQWGKLVEALLAPGCVKLFQEIGIKINQAFANAVAIKEGDTVEIDVLLANGNEVVIIEVKTTARPDDAKQLLKTIGKFREFFPHYHTCKIYGALAALRFVSQVDKLAAKQGFFVIEPHGEGMVKFRKIPEFNPKTF
ncbi:MAG: hypothetical protein HYY40_04400 [Bacteroidetes bacterium]|nr:hypothetical protein [Bacteroidota bacterium]